MSSGTNHTFVIQVHLSVADQLLKDLKSQGFEISVPPYTCFSGKKKGVSCTLYQSGKLLVQGREMAAFLEFYLEPQLLGSLPFTHPAASLGSAPGTQNKESRIGIDESGKGDFFGPLCVAGVYVAAPTIEALVRLGVKDSKELTDPAICAIAAEIKKLCPYHLIRFFPPTYNELYRKFRNLNRFLAWGHASAIEQLVEKTSCKKVLIDQFGDESLVENALKQKKLQVDLTQRHRGEEDLAVAAASIVAREGFLNGMDTLSQQLGYLLPKGCGPSVPKAAKEILKRFGEKALRSVCKEHFKTLGALLQPEFL